MQAFIWGSLSYHCKPRLVNFKVISALSAKRLCLRTNYTFKRHDPTSTSVCAAVTTHSLILQTPHWMLRYYIKSILSLSKLTTTLKILMVDSRNKSLLTFKKSCGWAETCIIHISDLMNFCYTELFDFRTLGEKFIYMTFKSKVT